jgi:putative glycerol-1-phosphate prenyltransferase
LQRSPSKLILSYAHIKKYFSTEILKPLQTLIAALLKTKKHQYLLDFLKNYFTFTLLNKYIFVCFMSNFLSNLYQHINSGKKALAVLIDPDQENKSVLNIAQLCETYKIDFVFVGGSLTTAGVMSDAIQIIKNNYSGKIYIFPGNEFMIDDNADGILFLSLLSGRNPEYLIGKHLVAAPILAASKLDIIPTAYLLIDGGKETSVSYISNTKPIPTDKPDIAMATALAGKMLGMQCVYMDAGSGALCPISGRMIASVKKSVDLPLIIGGGIRSKETASNAYSSGADLIVIGNGAEDDKSLIQQIATVRDSFTAKIEK